MAQTFSEIGEQVLGLRKQAEAMVATCNGLLRMLGPLVDEEAQQVQQEAPKGRRVFGQPDKE